MKLPPDQATILRRAADEPGDGWLTAVWIAESCGHAYDTPWAASKLPGLAKRGLMERGGRGWWRITEAGRQALKEHGDENNV